jgi:tight adherence protein B
MLSSLQITLVLLLLGFGAALFALRDWVFGASTGASSSSRSLRSISEEFRALEDATQDDTEMPGGAFGRRLAKESEIETKQARGISLATRLRYAQLSHYPVYFYSLVQVGISFVVFLVARLYCKEILQLMSLFVGPLLVNYVINKRIEKRARRFDADFPQFLLSVVGMLKTGLNTVQALQAGAEGLEETSLVRQEVELMLERLRLGVSEDRSIGSFGEDIHHEEIELFVQALILSRRVGGTLSDTLDRLAKQVRKRQNFKMAASGAVGMHRGSIWVILSLIGGLQTYMFFATPDIVIGTWQNPSLNGFAQLAIALMILGVLWMNKMTNFKV